MRAADLLYGHRWVLGVAILGVNVLCVAVSQAPIEEPLRIGVVLPNAPNTATSGVQIDWEVAEAARMGAIMAEEEFAFNAELMGVEFGIVVGVAQDAQSARQLAEKLVREEAVFALVGGFGEGQALALSRFAEDQQLPFLNIGSPNDSLRNEACNRFTFHVQPSAAMYLDALTGFFVRSGFRRWFYVYEDTEQGEALYRRALRSLRERHFGGREVGRVGLPAEQDLGNTLETIRRANPDLVLLLLEPAAQLGFLGQFESAGIDAEVTGFPFPAAQTRAFYDASREVAPEAGAGYRGAAWEATLDAYGARELNARFLARWDTPMDPSAWAAYQAIKILYEAALMQGSLEGPALVDYLESPQAVFDIWKGIGVTFRPWDHQLRQSLFLVKINPEADTAWNLAALVGELPALYLPRTDPVERLDQLGDLAGNSRCSF